MVKTRFSSLDVRAMVNSVRPAVVGCKLTNIYDINSKVYLLKLNRTGYRCFLLLESGVRFHLTNYERDKSSVPSNFTMKLRKHIRTRRLTAIEQLGCDRCIDLTFGRGENAFHLILELYVSGNVLLTDHDYRIVALLRQHTDQQTKVVLKEIYPREAATGLLKVPTSDFEAAIEELVNVAAQRQENQELKEMDDDDDKAKQLGKKGGDSAFAKRSKKRVDHASMPLVQLLHKLAPFADPALCASCISRAMKQASKACPNAFKVAVDDFVFEEVVELIKRAAEIALETLQSVSRPGDLGGGSMPVLEAAEDAEDQDFGDDEDPVEDKAATDAAKAAESLQEDETIVPGWIMRKRVHVPPTEPYWANEEFSPLCPEVADPEALVSFPTFHNCVDEFFTKLEEHKAAEQKAQHAKSVFDKVERIRVDQGRRVELLEQEQSVSERQAVLIEANVDLVELALAMVNTMVASQFDWGDLWKEVKRQQRLGHPIAQHIHALDLEHNEFQFLLSGAPDGEDSDDDEDRSMEVVPLDLNLSAHANVAKLHSKRKETREKTSRTLTHAETAVKHAEKKAQQDLQKFQLKQTIRRVRQNWWFEKYFWFISSENFLVVAGHDSQQTEHIFARQLGPHDVFVQADVAGARTCFVRNPGGGAVPPATLREAGTMALCHSTAWDKRIVISAWHVPVDQVARGGPPPKGDYVLVDGFYVWGRRQFLPPVHLEMGVTILFHVADASRHSGERRSRYLEAMGDLSAPREESDGENSDEGEVHSSGGAGGEACGSVEVGGSDGQQGAAVDDSSSSSAGEEEQRQPSTLSPSQERPMETLGTAPHAESSVTAEDRSRVAEEEGQEDSRRRGRISRAERKKLKKGEVDDDESLPNSFEPLARSPMENSAKAKATARCSPAVEAEPKAPPRGQRGKAKKIKDKYGEQDEEERQLRLALLGSKESKYLVLATASKVHPTAADDGEDDVADRSEILVKPTMPADVALELAPKEPKPPKVGDGDPSLGGGGGKVERPPKSKRDEVRLIAGCEAEDRGPNDTQLAQLEFLTGQPQPEDNVLYGMAMVAPYCALGGPYTYRAKLTPGPGKKGQVLKTCLKMFEQRIERRAWQILVQAIPENEAAGLMCGGCKAAMPGMQRLSQQVKKDVKKDKRTSDGGALPAPSVKAKR